MNLGPVGVQEGNGLLGEGLVGHFVEVGERLRVELLSERHLDCVWGCCGVGETTRKNVDEGQNNEEEGGSWGEGE